MAIIIFGSVFLLPSSARAEQRRDLRGLILSAFFGISHRDLRARVRFGLRFARHSRTKPTAGKGSRWSHALVVEVGIRAARRSLPTASMRIEFRSYMSTGWVERRKPCARIRSWKYTEDLELSQP